MRTAAEALAVFLVVFVVTALAGAQPRAVVVNALASYLDAAGTVAEVAPTTPLPVGR